MKAAEIGRRYVDFFAARDHTIVPSASLLYNDPTLLFVNAGMVPFKPYFIGAEPSPYKRAVSLQKCVRTLDIEEVGKTTRHGTFFQMNGNFSFGDYFKAGAIEYAWELVTGSQADGNYGFDPEKVWVTVYLDDDEAAALWRGVGVPDERIQRRGKAAKRRDARIAALLFDLDQSIQQLTQEQPEHPRIAALSGTYHNLLRMWSES